MKTYKYSARSQTGAIEKGTVEAESRSQAVKELQSRNLLIVEIDEENLFSLEGLSSVNIGSIPITEKVVFMRQLAVMIAAGLPLPQALEILKKQAQNPHFKQGIDRIAQNVQSGKSLGDAMAQEKKLFDAITINLIKAGEESGNLDRIFKRLATEWEKKREFESKVKGAMIYPSVILVAMVAVVALLMIFMIPTVKEIYSEFDADLPFITTFLIGISDFVISWWWLIIILLVSVVLGFKSYYDSEEGKKNIDEVLLQLPIFGDLITKIQLQQFTRVLYLLVKSGVPILEALDLVSGSLSNYWFVHGTLEAKKQVQKGASLALPISRDRHFPIIVSQMISVGEESGKLDEVLLKMSQYFENEVKNMTDNLTTLMEPLILILMGIVIGVMAVAVYLPMFTLSQVIG